jgi:hypothetical protein
MAYLWVITTVAVIAVFAAVAAPYVDQTTDVVAVRETSTILHDLSDGVVAFTNLVKRGPTRYHTPRLLNMLTTTPVTNGDAAGCTLQTYNSAAEAAWTANAPFTTNYVPVGGIWTPLGLVNDAPSNTDAAESSVRSDDNDPYYIQIANVDIGLARMLDLHVDGALDGAADTVRYTPATADSTTLLSYLVPLPHNPAC